MGLPATITAVAIIILMGSQGCAVNQLNQDLLRAEENYGYIKVDGIATSSPDGLLHLVLYQRSESWEIASNYRSPPEGIDSYFLVPEGDYSVAAFEDINRDRKYQRGEPAAYDTDPPLSPETTERSTELEFAAFTPTALSAAGARIAAGQGLANFVDPAFNTVTTHVPGASFPIYSNGAPLVATFGLGIAQDDVGLFHTISSYCDQVSISITCCPEMMQDPAHYANLLRASMQELELAIWGRPAAMDSEKRPGGKPKTSVAAAKRKKATAKKPRASSKAEKTG